MLPRLMMVGMVAALGITVPTRPEVRGCMRSIHSWTAYRLAALDGTTHGSHESIVTIPWAERARPVFEAISPDLRTSSIADELNRTAEGLDLPGEAFLARTRPRGGHLSRESSLPAAADNGVVPTIDDLESKLMLELAEGLDRSGSEPGLTGASISSPVDLPAAPTIVCAFTTTRELSPVRRTSPAAAPKPEREILVAGLIEPPTEAVGDEAGALNQFAQGIDADLRDPVATTARRPDFVPIDPDRARPISVVDELNRLWEGIETPMTGAAAPLAARPVARAAAPRVMSPGPDLAQAVRLTSDAFRAWMKIVMRPAVVQVSAR